MDARDAGRRAMGACRPRERTRPRWHGAAGLLIAGSAAAQTPPAPPPPPAYDVTLEPIRVRSQRDEERGDVRASESAVGVLGDRAVLDTPFSVNVVTRALLDKQQAAFLGDFLKNDPSASIGNVAVPFATLRGFSIGSDGMLFDGLAGHGAITDGRAGMQFIDHVDILKGASTTLMGSAAAPSLGGVLNFVPKRPEAAPVRDLAAGYTNRSLFDAAVDLGDRFGVDRQLGYRVNLGWRDGEQAVDRYDWTQRVAALSFDWRPRTGVSLLAHVDHVYNHTPSLPPFFSVASGVEVPDAPKLDRSLAQPWDDFETRASNGYLRLDWALTGGWTLTAQGLSSVAARPRSTQARFGAIGSAQGDMVLFAGQDASEERRQSGQVAVQGRFVTGAVAHRVSFGATASRQKSRGRSQSFDPVPSNLYDPVDGPEPFAPFDDDLPLTSRVKSESLFVSDTVDLTSQWSVLLGLRHARISSTNYGAAAPEQNEATKNVPVAALMWKPMPSSLVYLNYAEGLEQGGARSPVDDSAGFLAPISTRQLELGGKLEVAGLLLTAAVFDMRRPLEAFDADSGFNVQRGEQRHRGLELVANGRPLPGLSIVAGAAYLRTKVEGTGDAATEGRRAPGVPRFTANLWGEYRIASVRGLAVNSGLFHAGSQFLDAANTQRVPSWTRWDLGASVETRIAGRPAALLLNVENVAGRDYWASAQGSILTLADPRTIKLGLRMSL